VYISTCIVNIHRVKEAIYLSSSLWYHNYLFSFQRWIECNKHVNFVTTLSLLRRSVGCQHREALNVLVTSRCGTTTYTLIYEYLITYMNIFIMSWPEFSTLAHCMQCLSNVLTLWSSGLIQMIFKSVVSTAQKTHCVCITKTNMPMLVGILLLFIARIMRNK
jgi:hypothetical protein